MKKIASKYNNTNSTYKENIAISETVSNDKLSIYAKNYT